MMSPVKPFIKHLIISLSVFFVSLGVFLFLSPFIKAVLVNPQAYFDTGILPAQLEFLVIYILMVMLITSFSYIVYLLLTSQTRLKFEVFRETKWLATSQSEFKKLYESSPVPYVTLNKDGEIKMSNKSALRFFGAVPEEIEGKNFFAFQPEEDADIGRQLLQNYKLKVPINRKEIRMITKKSEIRWVLLSIFDMINSIDDTRIGLATIFDITEEKELDQAKSEFVTLASHQLRTPLATMKWYSDMLVSGEAGALTGKQKEYAERLNAINDEMIDLVTTLLNVSRIEIGALPVDRKQINVEKIANDIFEELTPQIELKKINIVKNYDNSLQNIESDPKLLRIVIQNLLTNAIKYTPEGGTVTITFEENPNQNQIIVSDTGYGIPHSVQDKVFTKLFRADNIKALNNSAGTGLGLYMVKSIIKSLGGDITFVSKENKGSIFTIKF